MFVQYFFRIQFPKSNSFIILCFYMIKLFFQSSSFKLLPTSYMENKLPVYTSPFPDNRNFCSRLFFSYSKVCILFLSCAHSAHTKRLFKTPHTHTPLCSYSFIILYLNDELVKNEESDLGSKSS